jgi:hypothetical protein
MKNGIYRNCNRCSKEYYVKPSGIATSKFCSKRCNCLSNTTKKQKTCLICHKSFDVLYSRISIAKYCSHECYNANRRKTAKEPRICQTCGISYPATKSSGKKYCSIQCCNKQKIKDGAPSFAAVRANMKKGGEITKCERCGYDRHPHILGIHHKDRNRENNVRNNLEVLCPNCHSLEHLNHICHGYQH